MSEEIGPKSSQVSEDGMAACDGVTSKRTLDIDTGIGSRATAFFLSPQWEFVAVVVLVSIIPQDGSTA